MHPRATERPVGAGMPPALAHIIDPTTRKTVGDLIRPQLTLAYTEGQSNGQLLLTGPKG